MRSDPERGVLAVTEELSKNVQLSPSSPFPNLSEREMRRPWVFRLVEISSLTSFVRNKDALEVVFHCAAKMDASFG